MTKISTCGGFCSGVKKAIDCALKANAGTYILGEIIHNRSVVDKLSQKGLITVDDIDSVPNGAALIIRSHGVGASTYQKAKQKNLNILDCTCAFVKKTQATVSKYYAMGYQIVIIGKANHPEVVGLNGWCENSALIIEKISDIDAIGTKPVCVVAQTTESFENFEKIIQNIKLGNNKTVEIFNTICYTTIKRQNQAQMLSKTHDAVIVLGGGNSSNTNKLYEICAKNCKNVFRAQNPNELDYNAILKHKKIAIVSGASTPDEQMQEVFSKMANSTQDLATQNNDFMEQALANIGEKNFKKGQIIKAMISSADDEGLAVLLPLNKKETSLAKEQIDCETYNAEEFKARVGEEIEVMVTSVNPLTVSQKAIKKIKEEEGMVADIEAGKEFTVTIEGSNKGGLTSKYASYQVFIPASEIRLGFENKFEKYVGKELRVKMLEIKKDGKKKEIIASHKVILAAEKELKDQAKKEKEQAFFDSINVGDVVEGKVERFSNFGAFVSVDGFDCLAHISDLSWADIKTPADVLEIGKTYSFKVLKVSKESGKVSIGYKQLQPEPWETVEERYQVEDTVTGKVVRIAPFGAFIEVEKGIDALVRVSEIAHEWVEDPTAHLAIGQEVQAKIMLIDAEARKMTLSIKALVEMPERQQKPRRTNKTANEEFDDSANQDKRPRRAKTERRYNDSNEIREWNEGGAGGASIGEMLNNR